MKFSATSSYFGALLIVLQGASAVLAAPTAGGKEYSYLDAYKPHSHAERSELSKREPCTASRKLKRKAWHTLTNAEKTAYLTAEQCLMALPAQAGKPGALTRFDDLVTVHQIQGADVHNDGWFLPFHRLHMHAHEKLLRDECGYTGAQPYWNETIDAGHFSTSAIFDPVYGFGGDGLPNEAEPWVAGCIQDGPFKDYQVQNGPGFENIPRCISRRINDGWSTASSQEEIDWCMDRNGDSFATAWPCIEGAPHLGGHFGVGGDMTNGLSSPVDPLFYLHHSFLDKLWWDWQAENLPARLTDIAGYTTGTEPATGWVNATLDDTLDMFGIIPNAQIRDIMDIGSDLLCFEYVN